MSGLRGVAAASVAISAAIALVLMLQRAEVGNAFELPIYRHLLLFQDYYVIAPFVGVLLLALLAPLRAAGDGVALWCGRKAGALALLTAAALAAGTKLVFHGHPLSLDEATVLFQSRAFAEGRLSGWFPPSLTEWLVPAFFEDRFFRLSRETGAIASAYWPGFALLLAPFTALGAPWMLNPLLSAASLLVAHRLALRLFQDEKCAGYVVLATLASPVFLVNGMSYYSMPAHMLANALFMLLLLTPSPRRLLVAGLVGSAALILHNPLPHVLFALPWLAWLAWRPGGARRLAWLFAGYAPLALIAGWGWPLYLENIAGGAAASVTPAGVFLDRLAKALGWTSTTGLQSRLLDLFKLWLWATPALVALAAVGAWRLRRESGPWRALAASALLTYFAYFLVQFDQGHGWGFRYFHSAWFAVPLFAAAAVREPGRSALAGYGAACAVLSLALLVPLRALQIEHFIARHLAQLPPAGPAARVVLLNTRTGYYAWDLVQNDPYLRNRVLVLASRGAQSDQSMMAREFPQYRLLLSEPRGAVWGVAER